MGFGLLFAGYILTANIVMRKYTDVLAYALMLRAASKLSPYEKNFRTAKTLLWGMLAVGFGWFAFSIVALFGVISETWVANVDYVLEIVSIAYGLFFDHALFKGIENLAEETEIPVLAMRAKRQHAITIFFDCVYLICIGVPFFANFTVLIAPIFMVLWIVIACMNASVIYSCYMWICLEGEEEVERKRSRFAIVNRIGDFFERIENAIAQKRGEEENDKLRRKIEENKKKRK